MTDPQMNWHQRSRVSRSAGERLADTIANSMGSWVFITLQTLFVIFWVVLNVIGWVAHWDAWPFILLNLLFSVQAAYAAPIIMMAQNRQAERDRHQAEADFRTNREAKREIEEVQHRLSRIEIDKLDKIIRLLEEKR